jgi:hypothetical protein
MAIDPYRFGAARHFNVAYLDVTPEQREEYKRLMFKYMYSPNYIDQVDTNPIFEETIQTMTGICKPVNPIKEQ